jgi:methyl coenzyme M reductase subunit C-like uncharacterized protein (methanogenesis marker protein 7)
MAPPAALSLILLLAPPDGVAGAPDNVVTHVVQMTLEQQLAYRLEKADRIRSRRVELEAERAQLELEEAELGIMSPSKGMHARPHARVDQHDAAHGGEQVHVFARAT